MTQARLLVVSPRFLFPLDQGGRIRTGNTLRHMKGGAFHITLASPAPPDAGRFRAELDGLCDRFVSWPERRLSRLGKLAAVAGRLPYSVATDASTEGSAVVRAALAEGPDAVLVDFPQAGVLMPPTVEVASILFTHNVEAEILARHAELVRGPMQAVWRAQARKMRRFEADTLRRYDRVLAVSVRDADALQREYGLARVDAVETGVDVDYYAYRPALEAASPTGGTVVFTGSMDSRSNIEGIEFLMDEVWPHVLRHRPDAEALIVGRNPPERLAAAAKGRGFAWKFSGFVDDVRPLVAQAHVYVIPLRVGSGTRMKVFEAMAMGCPVVSTTLGCEGLDVVPGEHLLVGDDARAFASEVVALLENRDAAERLAQNARDLVVERYSWQTVTRRFERICLEAAGR